MGGLETKIHTIKPIETPLTFKISNGGTINWKASNSSIAKTIEYKLNNGGWKSITSNTTGVKINVNAGDKIQFKGDNATYGDYGKYTTFSGSTAEFEIEGNIMSLINKTNFATVTTLQNAYTFNGLFSNCAGLTSAENLILPATTLAGNCYRYMFANCTSLATTPELPATTLAYACYNTMFYGCSSLTTAPALPATTLASGCYKSMFNDCSGLTTAPELPATTLAGNCYRFMFANCTSLTTVPSDYLPATTLASGCYHSMFQDCTSLKTATELPATTLEPYCYQEMFKSCSSLTTAPELPATTLTEGCYYHMFESCSSLTTAPELPATTLVDGCYQYMFYNCASLNYIKCLATDISATDCTYSWVGNVASTGTFVKAASMNDWTTGNNGIPSGWTVEDAS